MRLRSCLGRRSQDTGRAHPIAVYIGATDKWNGFAHGTGAVTMIKLFDLAARDDKIRFSPFCWRTKMALRHKALAFETIPWRFTEKERINQTGQGRVPVLIDDEHWVHDSWQIALYLDQAYADRPMLMKSDAVRAAARFMNFWCDLTFHLALRRLVFLDVLAMAADKDKSYFRESREKVLAMTLEEACGDREEALRALTKTLAAAEATLGENEFFGGAHPNYSDYVLFGSLQWANVISGTIFVAPSSAIA
jgi:glutathione S-transferase